MQLDISNKSLPVFEALASNVRLSIIQILSKKSSNIRELAEAVGLSSAIMTMHIKKLEKAGIIRTEMVPGRAGIQKLCILNVDEIDIIFPVKQSQSLAFHQTTLSVGHFTDFSIEPTCGLATEKMIIGQFDDIRYFLDPERFNAKILWFGKGFIEYKAPNFLLSNETPKALEISMELSSEAPLTNEHWPSDISFIFNGIELGTWTSPGDFGDSLGKYTPDWWPRVINQYGLLKCIRVTENGTFLDGIKLSGYSINDIDIEAKQWTFRIAIHDDAEHIGGVTLFGSGFGNYNQDILFRLFYEKDLEEVLPE
ncbi:transcriptional regulator [Halalkalibacter sp. APA_J-10(15)]|uniref:ArsR/SmtB family transcription factor n=1 Tax=unclassified Halalkalibacter TaxID=2893063 RepID=UPI001FF16B73|nr:ArsR family transcriptional regulator [Halalkalibacter sp. APA_J-10(15)]MCK0471968.1 helix-turn-helix domain-containing protein [Halalkalibacter sp. APA_J-10(15)]